MQIIRVITHYKISNLLIDQCIKTQPVIFRNRNFNNKSSRFRIRHLTAEISLFNNLNLKELNCFIESKIRKLIFVCLFPGTGMNCSPLLKHPSP